MEDIDPEFMPKDDEGDIKLPPEHDLNQEQNRTLTAEEIAEEKWHQRGARRRHGVHQDARAKEQRTPRKKTKDAR